MARLPQPGADKGVWGGILNDFLSTVHNSDGSLKNSVIDPNAINATAPTTGQVLSYDGAGFDWITSADSVSDASSSVKGIVQLTGDLGGTAVSPTVPGLATKADVSALTAHTTDIANPHAVTKAQVGLGSVDNTSDLAKPISTATQSTFDTKAATNHTHSEYLALKNNIVALTDSTNDQFTRVNISDDLTSVAGWPDRHAYYFSGIRTGYHNEYGELRARPAKINTIALRAMQWNGASTVDIFQVTNYGMTAKYFSVGPTTIEASVAISSTANITTTGQITGSNIGNKVTASSTAPSSPAMGDVWVDLSV